MPKVGFKFGNRIDLVFVERLFTTRGGSQN